MPFAAFIPLIAAAIGAAGSVAATKISADAKKKAAKRAYEAEKEAYEKAQANRFLFSDEQRDAARNALFSMLGMTPGGGEQGPGGAPRSWLQGPNGGPVKPLPPEFAQAAIQKILARYSTPSAAYQGWLAAQQERRDARSGVPNIPPQGAASPSAQRRTTGMPPGGRSY